MLRLRAHLASRDYIIFDLKLSFNVFGLRMYVLHVCVQDKTCKIFLPRFVIIWVMNLLNGIWRHHLLSNKVGQNSRPLDNIHFKFSAICVTGENIVFEHTYTYIYKCICRFKNDLFPCDLCKIYVQVLKLVLYFLLFLIRRRLSFLKTFLVIIYLFHNFSKSWRRKTTNVYIPVSGGNLTLHSKNNLVTMNIVLNI